MPHPRATAQEASTGCPAPHHWWALEILRTTLRHRSAAGHGRAPAPAACFADRIRAEGFPGGDLHVLPSITPDSEETASLVVHARGVGSSGQRSVILLAHTDAVYAQRQDGGRGRVTLIAEDGYCVGGGCTDDEFGVTVLRTTVLRPKEEGIVNAATTSRPDLRP
jgi:acetylornithine deacetylase/succinyl-diaminopimelate desuccinylase-like protein